MTEISPQPLLCSRHYHAPAAGAALGGMDYYVADFLLTLPPRIFEFFQTSSAFGDPLDLSDHPLHLDIFSLGPPSSVLGWVFYFFSKCLLRNTLMYIVRTGCPKKSQQ